jgi:subtilisin family serine protease
MRLSRPFALSLLALALSPAIARADDARIIVHHRAGLDAAERADIRADAGTKLERTLRLPNTEVVSVAEGTRAEALAELRGDPDVVDAETDDPVRPFTTDTLWTQLWGMFNPGTNGRVDADIDAEQAWTRSTGAGITVGVVDTGVQAGHPDLGGRVATGLNTVTNTTDTSDTAGHGTHVAGIIGATAANTAGVAGIAPDATIRPIKVFTGATAYESDIAEGFAYAGQQGIPVVNASLGGSGTSATIESAMAASPTTLFVVAAGNSGTNNDLSPVTPCVTSLANVLCVGASTIDDVRASFSNYGAATVDLFAPGQGIYSTYPTSTYAPLDGTSMASPYVAGTAALVAEELGLRGAALADQIKATVDHPAALGGLSVTGGRLNAARAVGAATDAPTQPVIATAQAGASSATLTMSTREADIASYRLYDAATGVLLTSATSPAITAGGLGAGRHDFVVVARNTAGQDSPTSAVASVVIPAATSSPTVPTTTQKRAGTATLPATQVSESPLADVRILNRHGRRTLTFRVTRTARVTMTLARRSGRTRYRTTARKTLRLVPGLQSLPITSRLLGMRVPRGAWRVTLSSGSSPTATVAFTRR